MASEAYIGMGSNLGDRVRSLRAGIEGLAGLGRILRLSSLYETEPVGGPPQGAYLNLVVRLETDLPPPALARGLFHLEEAAGRVRTVRWGPRTLDLDLLFYDRVRSDDPALTIPHPRIMERRFVLEPLVEIHPAAEALGLRAALTQVSGQPVRKLAAWPPEAAEAR